jgi:hypothetical protein
MNLTTIPIWVKWTKAMTRFPPIMMYVDRPANGPHTASHANIQRPCSYSLKILGACHYPCQRRSHPTSSLHKRCKHSNLSTVCSLQPTCCLSVCYNSDIQATCTVLHCKTETCTRKRNEYIGRNAYADCMFHNQYVTEHHILEYFTVF